MSEAVDTATRHRIPPPTGEREPLKMNVFEYTTGAACQLQPLFPYHGPGAIVPCTAMMQGVPGGHFGHFFHMNSIEEVAVTYASNNAMLGTGSIFATQRIHGVNSFLRDPSDPEAFVLVTITQHQQEDDEQQEAIIFRCQKCSAELVRLEFDASPPGSRTHDPGQWGGEADDAVPMFATVWGSVEATTRYNDEAVRTCRSCGHVNPPHPEPLWGWQRWVEQSRTANRARRLMQAAAESALRTEVQA
jgi:hypothetical protein